MCRYHVRGGADVSASTFKVFSDNVKAERVRYVNSAFPNLKNLYPSDGFDVSKIILQNTLFPFSSRFLSCEKKKAIFTELQSTGEKIYSNGLLRIYPNAKEGFSLRYCPLCNKESEEKYGEIYWSVVHQIRTLPLCPKHYCRLCDAKFVIQSYSHVFYPANNVFCPETTPDFSGVSEFEILLTDTLSAYQNAKVNFEEEPSYKEYLYYKLVNDGLLPVTNGKVFTQKIENLFIEKAGRNILDFHFCENKSFSRTIQSIVKNSNFHTPNHIALLSAVLGLPANAFITKQPVISDVAVKLIELSKTPYLYKTAYIKSVAEVTEIRQLEGLVRRLNIEPFWENHMKVSVSMKELAEKEQFLLKAVVTNEEKAMIDRHMKQLHVKNYSEYIRYCIRLELRDHELELHKFPIKQESRKTWSRKRTEKPDNWLEIVEALKNEAITVEEAFVMSNLTKHFFYKFLDEEPNRKDFSKIRYAQRRIPFPNNWEEIVQDYENGRITRQEAIERSGFSASTFRKRILERKNGLK